MAEMVFDACSNGRDIVKSDEVISYVRDNWVNKDSNLKQVVISSSKFIIIEILIYLSSKLKAAIIKI